MKAIFWKEWRENLRWALLGLAGMTLAQGYALAQTAYGPEAVNNHRSFESVCSALFLMTTTFGCAGIALVLGLLQTLPERSGDRWALLVHRPLSASRLFLGKAAAGLGLYLLATVPPLLASAAWAAWPGHIDGPFVPGMLIPGAMDVLAGVAWYFAGLLVGLREARWYGTRLLPLGAAWFVSVTVTGCWIVGDGIGYACWIGLALAVAAWGAFAGQGQDEAEAQPRVARLALFVALALGGYAVVFYGGEFGYVPFFKPKESSNVHREYRAGHDGTVSIAAYAWPAENYVTDLQGNLVPGTPREIWSRFTDDIQLGDGHPAAPLPHYSSYRWIGHYVAFNDTAQRQRDIAGAWFYLPGERRFVEYGVATRRLLARLGPDGATKPGEPCAPFPEPLAQLNPHSFLFPGAAYTFDEGTGEIVLLARADAGHPFYDVSGLPRRGDPPRGLPGAFAVTDDRQVSFFGPDGALRARVPQFHDPKVYRDIHGGRLDGDGFVLWYWKNGRRDQPGYLDQLDGAGNLVRETALPSLANKEAPRFWWWDANIYLRPFLTVAYDTANRVGQAWWGADPKRWQKGWLERTLRKPNAELAFLWQSLGWGLGGAALALAWAGFCGTPRRRALWGALGVLGFGPGALPAFVALCPWTGFERCGACGSRRRRDAGECPLCRTPVPPPTPDGREIFEPKA